MKEAAIGFIEVGGKKIAQSCLIAVPQLEREASKHACLLIGD